MKSGALRVRELGPPWDGMWDEIADQSPEATIYHTRAWAEILTQTFGHLNNDPRAFILEDGTEVVVPLISKKQGRFFTVYESAAAGSYGGPIARRVLTCLLYTSPSPRDS